MGVIPDRKFALLNWADALRLKKLYEESVKKCGEAIAVDPNYAGAYYCLGLALADQERFDEAIEQYRTAAALWETTGSPDRKFALYNWAGALGSKKLYEEAARKCSEVIVVDANFADAFNGLGLALAGQEASTKRSSNFARPRRCGRRPGLPTGSLPCSIGPAPWSRRSSTRRPQRSAAKPSPSIEVLRPPTTVLASRWRARSASTKRSNNFARPTGCGGTLNPMTANLPYGIWEWRFSSKTVSTTRSPISLKLRRLLLMTPWRSFITA